MSQAQSLFQIISEENLKKYLQELEELYRDDIEWILNENMDVDQQSKELKKTVEFYVARIMGFIEGLLFGKVNYEIVFNCCINN